MAKRTVCAGIRVQMHLDFGQKAFMMKTCSLCGMVYAPGSVDAERTGLERPIRETPKEFRLAGQVDDEATHAKFHRRVSNGIDFGVRSESESGIACSASECSEMFAGRDGRTSEWRASTTLLDPLTASGRV